MESVNPTTLEKFMRELFGAESDEEEEELELHGVENGRKWEQVPGVNGLWVFKGFLSPELQNELVETIKNEGWFSNPNVNQGMRFGDLPAWANCLSNLIRNSLFDYSYDIDCLQNIHRNQNCNADKNNEQDELSWGYSKPLSPQILLRNPLFDQMILNSYNPDEGIASHVDLMKFCDGIVILSLISPCVITFSRPPSSTAPCIPNPIQSKMKWGTNSPLPENQHPSEDGYPRSETEQTPGDHLNRLNVAIMDTDTIHTTNNDDNKDADLVGIEIPCLLNPGDLLIMSGEARYDWHHGIIKDRAHQTFQGKLVPYGHRISVTLRKLI